MVLLTVVEHQDLLDRYYLQTKNGLWHTVPDDGYIHAHLTWHLEQADRSDDIHILLQEVTAAGRNGWYEACDFLGKREQFVEDIERAWRLAEKMYCQESLKAIPSLAILQQSIGLQVRYALIFSTFHDSNLNIPAALIADLVRYKKWSVPQALDYAHRSNDFDVLHMLAAYLPPISPEEALRGLDNISDATERANILIKLAASLPDALWPEVLRISCSDYHYRTRVLKELVAHLPENMFPEVLELIRKLCNPDIAEAIEAVAAHLPANLWPEVFELACKISHDSFLVKALKSISAYLPKTLFPKLVKIIHEIQSDVAKIEIVVEMVSYLPEDLWSEILVIASNIKPDLRANMLGEISANLPKDLFPQAIEMICEIQYDSKSCTSQNIKVVKGISESIGKIATYSPKEFLPQLLGISRDLPYEYDRAKALMGLMPYLPTASEALETARHISSKFAHAKVLSKFVIDRPELLPEILRLVGVITDDNDRFKILHSLAICLPKEVSTNLLLDLLVMVSKIENRSNRTNTIIKLAAHLPEELLTEALEIALRITTETNNEFFRAFSLAGLAVYLTENMLFSAIKIVSNFREEENKSVALVGLARYLPKNLLSESFLIIQGFKNMKHQASTLRKLVDYWPEDIHSKPLSLELAMYGIQDEDCQLEVLCGLDDFLRKDDFKPIGGIQVESNLTDRRESIFSQEQGLALDYLDRVKRPKSNCVERAALLNAVAHFPENLLLEALNLAAEIGWLSSFFPVVIPRLPERLLPEALKMARETGDEYEKVRRLVTLLSHPSKILAPENLSSEAFETIENIQNQDDRIEALISLVPYLPNDLLAEVFEETAQNIQPKYEQARILSVAISQLDPRSIDLSFWSKMLHILAWRDRVKFLQDIPNLAPIIVHLSDRITLELIAQNISEVCQQWP